MGKIAIIGKQQPRYIRLEMQKYLQEQGHQADLLDMPTRNTADWKEALEGYNVIISAGEKIPGETIRHLGGEGGSLKLLSRFGVGTDEMDYPAAIECGVAICNAAGSFNRPVAECTLALALCLMRNIIPGNNEVHACDWSRFLESRNGIQMYQKTFGMIGFGGISQTLAKMLQPFECRIIAYDPYFNEQVGKELHVESVDMDTLLRESDIVSLNCPCTDETRDMVNKEFLHKMKSTAFFINTARGAMVVEEDLAEALKDGTIAGAGLDVLRQEPVSPDCPFLSIPNCILEPHIGANTDDAVMYAGMFAARNAADFLAGREVKTILNPEYKQHVKA